MSKVRVDTVEEYTSANGITIDGVNIKDGKIATANSIDSDAYVDGSIDTAHITDLNVTTAKIAADAITAAKIADDAINSEHYTDGSIDTAHIADNQVTTAKIGYAEATLTDQATIAWDVAASPVAKVTLGANRTLGAASNGTTGQFVSLLVIQDGTGSRTVTWNAVYEFASDTAPTLTTTAAKGDLFVFRYNGAKYLEVGRNLALTLS